jgi:hypothetical protein
MNIRGYFCSVTSKILELVINLAKSYYKIIRPLNIYGVKCIIIFNLIYIMQCEFLSPSVCVCICTRWFKYDRDKLSLVYTQTVPVIFEPPCMYVCMYVYILHLVLQKVTKRRQLCAYVV